jgi:hypothetical protein
MAIEKPVKYRVTGQLYFLFDKSHVSNRPEHSFSAKAVDLNGKKAVMVFRSEELANKCRMKLGDPHVATATFQNMWEAVAVIEIMERAGVPMVAIDYEPGQDPVLGDDIHHFAQYLRETFGVKDIPKDIQGMEVKHTET